MPEQSFKISDKNGNLIRVELKRDKRLRKTSRWERLAGGSLLLRIPHRLPRFRVNRLLEQVSMQLDKANKTHARRSDTQLHERAQLINQKHFNGMITWNAIRWVSNMHSRLGSCTRGGPTDGQIRISDRINNWPDWVLDYVIAHELMHRKHSNHSKKFWEELKAAYPLTERARGFIEGMDFARGKPADNGK